MVAQKDPMVPTLYRVRSIHKETYDTFTLEMRPVNGTRLAPFSPGQFNMLYVFGVGEVPISISGNPAEGTSLLIHTARAVGLTTQGLCGLKAGDTLGVRGPFGTRW